MHANKLQKEYLLAFLEAEYADSKAKIDALIRMSEIVIPYKKQTDLHARRAQFDAGKATLHKMWIGKHKLCWVCGSPATIRHHIIQLKNGGINSRKNVLSLCDPCHAEIHPWLKIKTPSPTHTNWGQPNHEAMRYCAVSVTASHGERSNQQSIRFLSQTVQRSLV